MQNSSPLSDSNHPTIQNLALRLARGKVTVLDKLQGIFDYVRDEIKFGFPPLWDVVPASETVYYGIGYCNTKATLFVALCQAAGIPARLHFGLIDARVLHGILPFWVFPFMPKMTSHAWAEVQLDGAWKPVDSYILDKPFYERARVKLEGSRQSLGYALAFLDGKSSCELNFGDKGFIHMGAVRQDQGAWEDASYYFTSGNYVRFSRLQKLLLPVLLSMGNQKIARLRSTSL